MKILFAHGFEGVPTGRKPQHLREVLGHEVVAPLMNEKGWTFEDQVTVVCEALAEHPELQLVVGSSMGGFAASVAASRHPDRDLRLLLLAPAVGIHAAWAQRLGETGLARWRDTGFQTHFHRGRGVEVTLPYALFSQCCAHAGVVLDHPTVIIHGLQDETIAIDYALALAKRSPGVKRMYAVADGHRLQASRHLMGEAIDLLLTP